MSDRDFTHFFEAETKLKIPSEVKPPLPQRKYTVKHDF